MVKVIPARIEEGRVVPEGPLPDAATIGRVSIVVDLVEAAGGDAPDGDLARLMRLAGSIRTGRPTGTDNEGIDADLAREYGVLWT
jgi:hypothetical protein